MITRIAAFLFFSLLAGCQNVETPFGRVEADSVAGDDSVAAEVFLIGDAGEPAPDGEPVLVALSRHLAERPERSFVVFLGDNIYPDGLPPEGHPDREVAERYLQAQIDVARQTGVRTVFVPGNHDWGHSRPDGLDRIREQAAFIEARGDTLASMLPADGCPGPAVLDLHDAVRIVAVDSQWFLHPHERPLGNACAPTASVARFSGVLRSVLADAATADGGPRPTIVVAHHPIASGGAHGILPAVPRQGFPRPMFSPQDLGHRSYRAYRAIMAAAFAAHPPLIYAAGHDHSLQVIAGGGGARYALVSGAGIYGHTSGVRRERGSLYAERKAGYMRVSVYANGRVDLRVYEVSGDGQARIGFTKTLVPPRS